MNVFSLFAEIDVNDKQYTSKLDRLERDTGRAATKMEQAFSRVGDRVERLGRSMQQFGTRLSLGVTLPLAAIGTTAINAASRMEESRARFQTVFRDIGDSAEASANRLSDSFGLSNRQARDLLGTTGDLLTGFGFTQESALDLSTQVNELAVDLASFTNLEGGAERASKALTSALLGEREAVKSLGISIQEADVQARMLENAQAGLTFETERQAKAFATLQIAQEQSKNATGDYARTQDSFANQTRSLRANLEDLAGVLGEALLPLVTRAVGFVNGLVERFENMDDRTATLVVTIGGLAAAAGPIIVILGTLITNLGAVAGLIGTTVIPAVTAFGATLSAAIWPITAVVAAVGGLYLAYRNNFLGIGDVVDRVIGWVGDRIRGIVNVFQFVMQNLQDVQWFFGITLDKILRLVSLWGETFTSAWNLPLLRAQLSIARFMESVRTIFVRGINAAFIDPLNNMTNAIRNNPVARWILGEQEFRPIPRLNVEAVQGDFSELEARIAANEAEWDHFGDAVTRAQDDISLALFTLVTNAQNRSDELQTANEEASDSYDDVGDAVAGVTPLMEDFDGLVNEASASVSRGTPILDAYARSLGGIREQLEAIGALDLADTILGGNLDLYSRRRNEIRVRNASPAGSFSPRERGDGGLPEAASIVMRARANARMVAAEMDRIFRQYAGEGAPRTGQHIGMGLGTGVFEGWDNALEGGAGGLVGPELEAHLASMDEMFARFGRSGGVSAGESYRVTFADEIARNEREMMRDWIDQNTRSMAEAGRDAGVAWQEALANAITEDAAFSAAIRQAEAEVDALIRRFEFIERLNQPDNQARLAQQQGGPVQVEVTNFDDDDDGGADPPEKQLQSFGDSLLDVASRHVPAFGAALQGLASGGPIGAIVAVFSDLLGESEAFASIMETINTVLAPLVRIIDVLFQALSPLINLILKPLTFALEFIADAFTWVANAIIDVYNFLLGWLFGNVPNVGDRAPSSGGGAGAGAGGITPDRDNPGFETGLTTDRGGNELIRVTSGGSDVMRWTRGSSSPTFTGNAGNANTMAGVQNRISALRTALSLADTAEWREKIRDEIGKWENILAGMQPSDNAGGTPSASPRPAPTRSRAPSFTSPEEEPLWWDDALGPLDAEQNFGATGQSVQLAVATPLVQASERMLQAANMMMGGGESGVFMEHTNAMRLHAEWLRRTAEEGVNVNVNQRTSTRAWMFPRYA